jgi:hypothetical protein
MSIIVKPVDVATATLVADYLARGGRVTVIPMRRRRRR